MDMRCFPQLVLFGLVGSLSAQSDQALSLVSGGSDEFLEVSSVPTLVPEDAITIEAWITYDDATIPTGGNFLWPTIVRHTDGPGIESYWLRVQAGANNNLELRFAKRSPAGALEGVSYSFAAGEFATWTHIAATFRGTSARLFKNGVLVAQQNNLQAGIADGGGTLRIGCGYVPQRQRGVERNDRRGARLAVRPFRHRDPRGPEQVPWRRAGLPYVPARRTRNRHFAGFGWHADHRPDVRCGRRTVPASFGAVANGGATTTCGADSIIQTLGSSARAGNTAFQFVCADATPQVPGALLIAALPLGRAAELPRRRLLHRLRCVHRRCPGHVQQHWHGTATGGVAGDDRARSAVLDAVAVHRQLRRAGADGVERAERGRFSEGADMAASSSDIELVRRGAGAVEIWRADHPRCVLDLAEADLSNARLDGVDLSGADLARANLSGSDLVAADLSGANLASADLSKACLVGARMDRARFDGANLEHARLQRATLAGCSAKSACLRNANVSEAGFTSADLSGACFLDAWAKKANFEGASLINADLRVNERVPGAIWCCEPDRRSIHQRDGVLLLAQLLGPGELHWSRRCAS